MSKLKNERGNIQFIGLMVIILVAITFIPVMKLSNIMLEKSQASIEKQEILNETATHISTHGNRVLEQMTLKNKSIEGKETTNGSCPTDSDRAYYEESENVQVSYQCFGVESITRVATITLNVNSNITQIVRTDNIGRTTINRKDEPTRYVFNFNKSTIKPVKLSKEIKLER